MDENRTPLIIGCDHAALALKERIKAHLKDRGLEVEDAGTHSESSVNYVTYGIKVAEAVSRGERDRGILLCGTGLGMAMTANKFSRVRAALCNDLFSAIMSRSHNDANILVLGARVIGDALALSIVDAWLDTPFEGGRHRERIATMEPLGR